MPIRIVTKSNVNTNNNKTNTNIDSDNIKVTMTNIENKRECWNVTIRIKCAKCRIG